MADAAAHANASLATMGGHQLAWELDNGNVTTHADPTGNTIPIFRVRDAVKT